MGKAYSGVGNTQHEFLGAGAVYLNWELPDETLIGVSKGGASFTDNAEFREREADGDYAPVKGHRNITKITPQLTVNTVKLNTYNITKFLAGTKTDNSTDGKTKIYRKLDLNDSYIKNVAFVTANREGRYMVIVLKNVLGDGAFDISTAKDDEIVPSIQFTAHIDEDFDPDDETTYPYYIEKDTSKVTFTVVSGEDKVKDAEIVIDGHFVLTDTDGKATVYVDKADSLRYYVKKDGYVDIKENVEVTTDTKEINVNMQAIAKTAKTTRVTKTTKTEEK